MPGAPANSVVGTARYRGLRLASLAALKAFQIHGDAQSELPTGPAFVRTPARVSGLPQ
jgi:hypothetical protein